MHRIAWLCFAFACDQGEQSQPQEHKPSQARHSTYGPITADSTIELHSQTISDMCGFCGFRQITIKGDGEIRDTDEKGAHRTVIRPSPLRSLVTRLEAVQFLDLQPSCGVRIDHGTFTSIEVSLPAGHHRVERVYSYCDEGKRVALTKLADTILEIADHARR